VLPIVLSAALAPWVAPFDPATPSLLDAFEPPRWGLAIVTTVLSLNLLADRLEGFPRVAASSTRRPREALVKGMTALPSRRMAGASLQTVDAQTDGPRRRPSPGTPER
jgi:hypothetical protein